MRKFESQPSDPIIVQFTGTEKIPAIRAIRMVFGLSLRDAKDTVESESVQMTQRDFHLVTLIHPDTGWSRVNVEVDLCR